MVGIAKTDLITQQLTASSNANPSALYNWVEYCTQRDAMLYRTRSCALASWLLVFSVATFSTLMAWHFQKSTLEAMELLNDGKPTDESFSGTSFTYPSEVMLADQTTHQIVLTGNSQYLMPSLLLICLVFALMPIAWRINFIPLFRKLRNDIDWTTIGQAMGQLTPLGIPYPVAFRLTAESLRCKSHRKWLERAAQNVESGQPVIGENLSHQPNTAVLYAVLTNCDSMAKEDWKVVAQHYDSCSKRTLSLLLAAIPVAATLVAGVILWVTITSTFGDFYSTLYSTIQQFGY